MQALRRGRRPSEQQQLVKVATEQSAQAAASASAVVTAGVGSTARIAASWLKTIQSNFTRSLSTKTAPMDDHMSPPESTQGSSISISSDLSSLGNLGSSQPRNFNGSPGLWAECSGCVHSGCNMHRGRGPLFKVHDFDEDAWCADCPPYLEPGGSRSTSVDSSRQGSSRDPSICSKGSTPRGSSLYRDCITPRDGQALHCLDGSPEYRSPNCPHRNFAGAPYSKYDRVSSPDTPELHILYASPLDERLHQIDIREELELLREALEEAECPMRVRVGIATAKGLAQLLTLTRSGVPVILHLSAHVALSPNDGFGLVLEDGHGGPHVLYKSRLEELIGGTQKLEGLSLVFLNTCWSESLAQIFIESGCRHVIGTRGQVADVASRAFTHQFYFALGSHHSVLDSWEGAQKALRVDPNPKLPASADLFVLFGQRGAGEATLSLLCNRNFFKEPEPRSLGRDKNPLWLEDATAIGIAQLPPRPEDFVARSQVIREILDNFDSGRGRIARRTCIVSGPEGIGKSAVAIELAHFAAAPGRLFSQGVIYARLYGDPDVASLQRAILEGLESLEPQLMRNVLRPTSAGSSASAASNYSLDRLEVRSLSSRSSLESLASSAASDADQCPLEKRRRQLRRAFQQLDRRRRRRLLLLVDDEVGAIKGSKNVGQALGELLELSHQLCIAVFCRDRVYDSLGSCKCVNFQLPPLSDMEASRLFLKRIHRPLRPGDLERGAQGASAVARSEETLTRLEAHPLLQTLAGNPGKIRGVSERVTPDLNSLFDLLGTEVPNPAIAKDNGYSHPKDQLSKVDCVPSAPE